MAWIESHQELPRHPKTKKLARLLGIEVFSAVGLLHMLWYWCLDYAQDGNLGKHDAYEIADALGWQKDPDELFAAFISSGYIDVDGNVRRVHNWEKYGGRLLALRRHNAEKQRKFREEQDKKSGRQKSRLRMA
jgi:hypothetical protein